MGLILGTLATFALKSGVKIAAGKALTGMFTRAQKNNPKADLDNYKELNKQFRSSRHITCRELLI